MKIIKLVLAMFFIGIFPGLSAQQQNQNIPAPKKLVFDPVQIDLSRFNLARFKNKTISYPVIAEKEKLALSSANSIESKTAGSVITITVEDGKLISHLPPKCAETYDVQPNDYFFLKAEDADIEFTKDEKGSINLIIKQKAVTPVKNNN